MGNRYWQPEEKVIVEKKILAHIRSGKQVSRSILLVSAELDKPYEKVHDLWYKQLGSKHKKELDKLFNRSNNGVFIPEYTALDTDEYHDFNFNWKHSEVEQFDKWYAEGVTVNEMARRFKRDPDEVAVLLFDRARRNKIRKHKQERKTLLLVTQSV